MTRASAANAGACPGITVRRSKAASGRKGAGRRWIPPFALVVLVATIVAVIVMTLQHLRFERDLALTEAAREVGLRATLLAGRVNASLAAAPQISPAEIFRRVLGAHPEERFAEAALVDRDGRRIAVDPPEATAGLKPEEIRSPAADGEFAVIRVSTDGAGDRFTAVRALPATAGRIAFVSPVELHLAAWRRAATVTVVLLGST